MCKGRGSIYLPYFTVLVLALALILAIPQANVLAKEPPTFPTSDNETVLATVLCPGGIAINNGIINIDYFGERFSEGDVWLYPNSFYNCYYEQPSMSFDIKLPQPLSGGIVTQCYPLTGNPDTWYEAIVNLDLDGGAPDVEVHRQVMVPSDQSYFFVKYTIVNIKGIAMPNFRFFQGVDYDVASSSDNDEGGYDRKDFVWEHDLGDVGTYVGFKGDRGSAHHDVDYYSTMWNHIAAGTLNDANYYNGDVGVALEWDLGDLPASASKTLTVTFAFAPDYDELFVPSSQQITLSQQPHSSPPSQIPPMRLKQAILSTNYAQVTPQQTYANQPITISTNVVNAGDETGNYNVVLRINGLTEQSKMVSVGPGGTYPVKFTVTKAEPGTYIATVDGHKADFIVLGNKTSKSSASSGVLPVIIAGIIILFIASILILSFRRSA